MNTRTTKKLKRGPVPSGHKITSVIVSAELIEWAKHQPERMTGLVRRLLEEEYRRRTMPQNGTTVASEPPPTPKPVRKPKPAPTPFY